MRRFAFFILTTATVFFASCDKTTEQLDFPKLDDYYPLTVGKYITYKIDSAIFLNFGTKDTVRSYEVKHVVDAQVTDALGRAAYRIIRYIRKTPANAWVPDNTFMAIPTGNAVEFVENNFRFIKLKDIIKDGFSWKGNSFIDTYSINSNVKYLDDWDYTYDSLNVPVKLSPTLTVDNTIRVLQRDETINNPADPNVYSEKNLGIEKYAKGIGLVYRVFYHREYQPPTPGSGGFKTGYGVTLTMIDHN
jgi:hypothetical protein